MVSKTDVTPASRSLVVAVSLLSFADSFPAADRRSPVQQCSTQGRLLLDSHGKPRILSGRSLENSAATCVAPKFPSLANSLRFEGSVFVKILVDERGRVTCAYIVHGHPLMSRSAIEAAQRWTFRPKSQDGRPVSFYGILAFSFSTSVKEPKGCLDARW